LRTGVVGVGVEEDPTSLWEVTERTIERKFGMKLKLLNALFDCNYFFERGVIPVSSNRTRVLSQNGHVFLSTNATVQKKDAPSCTTFKVVKLVLTVEVH
ncbi:hypothetical protein Tco_0101206, partial [Tanacetum coccineum]